MTIYNYQKIQELTESQIQEAKSKLKELKIYCNNIEPKFTGLNGWVFEQVIQYCLIKEFKKLGITNFEIKEQAHLDKRKKLDLMINNKIAVEIKRNGIYGKGDIEKYTKCKEVADEKKLIYLYITPRETYKPYQVSTVKIFGKENCFFLDENDWERFVNRIYSLINY